MSRSVSRSRSRSHSRSDSRRRSNSRPRSKQIFVTRISRRTNSQDLRDVFRRYGHIRNVSMKRSYAFIEYSDYNDAQYAVRRMNGKEVDGSRLVVQIAGDKRKEPRQGSQERKRGPQKEDVCYNCQETGHWANECRNARKARRRSRSASRSRSQGRRRRSFTSANKSEQDRKRNYKKQSSSRSNSKSRSDSSSQSKNSKSQSRSLSSQKA